jgi:DNA-binding FadR family transcriptional regulator
MAQPAASLIMGAAAATPEQVYAALRTGLEAGEIAPGGRLASERALAARFGTSRGAIRRALARLAGEGLIERRIGRAGSRARAPDLVVPRTPASGPVVSPQDVLEARLAVEPGFVDLVIARGTEEDFGRMAACLTRMETAPTQQAFREAGYAFHLELARATRNPLLVHLFEAIIEARARAGWGKLRALNERPEQRAAQIAKNWRTLGHLRARDARAARLSLAEHLAQMLREVAGPHHAPSDEERDAMPESAGGQKG